MARSTRPRNAGADAPPRRRMRGFEPAASLVASIREAAATLGHGIAGEVTASVGVAVFLSLNICAGIFATLGYALVHPASTDPLVGASGAVCIGAAAVLGAGVGQPE